MSPERLPSTCSYRQFRARLEGNEVVAQGRGFVFARRLGLRIDLPQDADRRFWICDGKHGALGVPARQRHRFLAVILEIVLQRNKAVGGEFLDLGVIQQPQLGAGITGERILGIELDKASTCFELTSAAVCAASPARNESGHLLAFNVT